MTDPFSVVTGAAGIVSLGITVLQGLIKYYEAYKSRDSDIDHTISKIARLLDVLSNLRDQLDARRSRYGDDNALSSVVSSIEACTEIIQELEEELDKFERTPPQGTMASFRAAGRRAVYPFRPSTLQKLEEDVDDLMSSLSFAVQVLQQSDIGNIQANVDHTKALLNLVRASQVSSNIRHWLNAPDASINFNEALKKKHPGTGSWFVEGPDFTTWLTKPNSFLWLVGFAGCGKSVLCATVIQSVFQRRGGYSRIGVAFFFFTFNDQGKQDASAMLRALVLQLSAQLDNEHTQLSQLHRAYRDTTPPESALLECLLHLVRAFDDVYIVLDALDESPRDKHRETLLDTLADLRTAGPTLHLLVSSRDEMDIREGLEPSPGEMIPMKNDAIDSDIASFISQQLRQRLRRWADFHPKIQKALASRANGVFRWVECQLKVLAHCPGSEDLLEQALDSLPPTLDETYRRMLDDIPPPSKLYARQMLTMLCCAMRPLSVKELLDGIAVELGDPPRYNPKRRLQHADEIRRICPGFIEIHKRSEDNPHWIDESVQLAHFSVREYLESERIEAAFYKVIPRDAHAQMTSICLTLLLDPVSPVYPLAPESDLSEYALDYWQDHFARGRDSARVEAQVLQLFTHKDMFQIWSVRWEGTIYQTGTKYTPLYYASLYGLEFVVAHFLEGKGAVYSDDSDDDCGNQTSGEPEAGTSNTLAMVNEWGGPYGTALAAASVHGHEGIIRLLLDKGADTNHSTDGEVGTALIAASWAGREPIVHLLLERGADINAEAGDYGTALVAAAASGHESIVHLLLEKGAGINAGPGLHGTALIAAAATAPKRVVRLLLGKGADVNAGAGFYGRALIAAAARGHKGLVRLLIKEGADVNAEGGNYGTALIAAAAHSRRPIIRRLLKAGADINAKGGRHGTALGWAAAWGHEVTVRLLLKKGADINMEAGIYGTALGSAVAMWRPRIIRYLLRRGVDTAVYKSYDAHGWYVDIQELLGLRDCSSESDDDRHL